MAGKSQSVVLKANSFDRRKVEYGGNMGIGSTAPQSVLTLGTNAHLGSTGTAPTVANNDCGSTYLVNPGG